MVPFFLQPFPSKCRNLQMNGEQVEGVYRVNSLSLFLLSPSPLSLHPSCSKPKLYILPEEDNTQSLSRPALSEASSRLRFVLKVRRKAFGDQQWAISSVVNSFSLLKVRSSDKRERGREWGAMCSKGGEIKGQTILTALTWIIRRKKRAPQPEKWRRLEPSQSLLEV